MKELCDLGIDTWYSYRILLASFQGLTYEDLGESSDLVGYLQMRRQRRHISRG